MAVRRLFDLNGSSAAIFRNFFFVMGNRLTLIAKAQQDSQQVAALSQQIKEYDRQCRVRDARIAALSEKIEEYDRLCRATNQKMAEQAAKINEYDDSLRSCAKNLAEKVQAMRSELIQIKAQLEAARKQIVSFESTIIGKVIRSLKSP